jgi:hypothetical protein
VHQALIAAGVPIMAPSEFTRPVELADETRDARFRTVRVPHDAVPAGRLYFCHHFTRDLVWRDEWRHHANGAIAVVRAIIAAEEPDAYAALFRRMFGNDAVVSIDGGFRLLVGASDFDIVAPVVLSERYGDDAAPADGRAAWMAALSLRTRSLARAESALRDGGIPRRHDAGRILVSPIDTLGVTLEFVA